MDCVHKGSVMKPARRWFRAGAGAGETRHLGDGQGRYDEQLRRELADLD